MSAEPDTGAGAARAEVSDDGQSRVDARHAVGVQVGEKNTQIVYNYGNLTWTDAAALPPLVTVHGKVDSPYRGLRAFEERDAPFFFGREAAATDILGRMSRCVAGPGLLVVSGVSGAGKSSLLRAGVLPRIRGAGLAADRGAAHWPCLLLTPGPRRPHPRSAARGAAGLHPADRHHLQQPGQRRPSQPGRPHRGQGRGPGW